MPKTLTLEVMRKGIVSTRPGRAPQEKTYTKKVTVTKRLAENIWGAKIRGKFYGLFRHPKATGQHDSPKWTIESRRIGRPVKWVVLDDIKESDLPQEITEANVKKEIIATLIEAGRPDLANVMAHETRAAKLKVGDTVKYKASFIKSTQLPYDIASRTGVIKEIKPLGKKEYAKVLWEGESEPKGVLMMYIMPAKAPDYSGM